jgi:hypothetical protein
LDVGRPENKRRNTRIAAMLKAGTSYSDIQEATGCSRATKWNNLIVAASHDRAGTMAACSSAESSAEGE